MITLHSLKQALLGRDVAVAYAILMGLYLLKFVGFQPLTVPPYLLIVTYGFVEMAVPVLTPYYPVAFPVFLYLLAVVGASIARLVQTDRQADSTWIRTAGGVFLLVGSISLLFGAVVGGPLISSTDNPTPLAITGLTGIIFLVGSWLVLRHSSPQTIVTRSDQGPD